MCACVCVCVCACVCVHVCISMCVCTTDKTQCVIPCYRWRTSFLLSLIFGLPAMVVMMYFMFGYTGDSDEAVTSDISNSTTARPRKVAHKPQLLITNGLSMENLLMFLLATPVQVSIFMMVSCTSWPHLYR